MPKFNVATPQISLRLYKTISRKTVDGSSAVSTRYAGKKDFIDLTPFLSDRSVVRTSKSVRDPSGGFSISFADKADRSFQDDGLALESVYGLIEPMDMVEIRMWGGLGSHALKDLPIAMRGFVTDVQRSQSVDEQGRPQRTVTVNGHDYGKIWQMFQVLYLAAYAEGQSLLTNFGLWEMFGVEAANALPAADFVRTMVTKILNPYLDKLLPQNSPMPRVLQTGESLSVAHGMVNNSYQQMEGSIYDILRFHGDVGVWNELYTEDREDGVHVVYRPTPALHITKPSGASTRKIQDDAPDPVYCDLGSSDIQSLSTGRSDANVANFFWVNNSRFDLIDDMQRKLASIPKDDGRVSLKEYPNSAVQHYGLRPMNAATQQAGDGIINATSGLPSDQLEARRDKQEAWIDKRRRLMLEMNRDNVVFERGSMSVKGGPTRDGSALLRAGDYVRVQSGRVQWEAYVVQVDHVFAAFTGYSTSITFERGTGFSERSQMGSGLSSPWLAERASSSVISA